MFHSALKFYYSGKQPQSLKLIPNFSLGALEIVYDPTLHKILYYIAGRTQQDLLLLQAQLKNFYEGIEFIDFAQHCVLSDILKTSKFTYGTATLQRYHYYPLNVSTVPDPAEFFVRTISALPTPVCIQILFKPSTWFSSVLFSHYDKVYMQLKNDPSRKQVLEEIQQRIRTTPFQVQIRVAAMTPEAVKASTSWLQQFAYTTLGNAFQIKIIKKQKFQHAMIQHDPDAFLPKKEYRLLSDVEIARLIPIPWQKKHTELVYVEVREHKAPVSVTTKPQIVIGTTRNNEMVSIEDFKHLAVFGKTRTGKSTFLHNLSLQLLQLKPNATAVVIDPHGSLVENIKATLTPELAQRTIELNPADTKFAPHFNILHIPERNKLNPTQLAHLKNLIISDLIYTIRNVWGEEFFGPRIDYFITTLAKGLLEFEHTNLVDLYYILTSKEAQKRFARIVTDPTVKNFVVYELPKLKYEDSISTINKVGKIVQNEIIRTTLCQRLPPYTLDAVLESHKLVLVNLSKTNIGPEASKFIGATLLTQLWLNVLQRKIQKEVYLIMDEFQNFASNSFAEILSESAKFHLHLVLANQYMQQLPEELVSALVGNVDTWCFFTLGADDAKYAEKLVSKHPQEFSTYDFVALPPFNAIINTQAFTATVNTLPPPQPTHELHSLTEKILANQSKFACEDNSIVSALILNESEINAVLSALKQPQSFLQLAQKLPIPPETISQILRYLSYMGYVVLDTQSKTYILTSMGRDVIKSVEARMMPDSESEWHADLLARFAAYLQLFGINLEIQQQVPGEQLPDATYKLEDGVVRNVEVECSTIHTKSEQVLKNFKKARDANRKCVLVVNTADDAQKIYNLLNPLAEIENEYYIMYPDEKDITVFKRFIPKEAIAEKEKLNSEIQQLKTVVEKLKSENKKTATAEELLRHLPGFTPVKLGILSKQLGIKKKRIRQDGKL
ncbi:MAG: DUF87 domain-containing protein, partial [Thermoplasmata archaeon]